MKIEIKIDETCKEPKVVVLTDRITEEVNGLVKKLSETPRMLAGFRGETLTVLDQAGVSRVYAEAGKVYAQTDSGKYLLRLRLYELEERLDPSRFARISNSEIVNLRKVRGFDLNLAGTIRVALLDGTVTYVSRRYVPKIKQVLGI